MVRDWRDPAAYAYTADRTLDLWAWEFLRRNEEYQGDWRRQLQAYLEHRRIVYSEAALDVVEYIDEPEEVAIEAGRRWGLMEYVNPSIDNLLPVFTGLGRATWEPNEGLIGRLYVVPDGGDLTLHLRPTNAVAVFDLTAPLRPQLAAIERRLRVQQARRPRPKGSRNRRHTQHEEGERDHWPRFVQAFDGRRAGATLAEIGKVLFNYRNNYPDNKATKAAEHYLQRAEQLINGGYRDLPPVGV